MSVFETSIEALVASFNALERACKPGGSERCFKQDGSIASKPQDGQWSVQYGGPDSEAARWIAAGCPRVWTP